MGWVCYVLCLVVVEGGRWEVLSMELMRWDEDETKSTEDIGGFSLRHRATLHRVYRGSRSVGKERVRTLRPRAFGRAGIKFYSTGFYEG
jgi:hypothetical protein